jgi:hypothetical protein
VKVIALSGGGIKTAAGEAQTGGLLAVLKTLDPETQRGALPAVIAALDTDPKKDDLAVASLRRNLESELAGIPVDPADARERLTELAREYEALRKAMASGPQRTFKMTQLVAEARGIAAAAQLYPRWLTDLYVGHGDGDRVVSLAVIQAMPDKDELPLVVESIRAARSPFEQYQGLLAGLAVAPRLSREGQQELRAAVQDRMRSGIPGVQIDERDSDRLNLAKRLLDATK